MTARLVALCIDALDPHRLAAFWAEAMGWNIDESHGETVLVPTDNTAFSIEFRHVTDPKTVQNRLHLDLTTTSPDNQTESVARLLEAGGRHADIGQSPDEDHIVLADPEGNELCILAPFNNFLAGAERLGSINCDGTKEVGYFWSEALGWPLVWDQDEETAIREILGEGPLITWSGPPLMPKPGKNRLHLHIAPPVGVSQEQEAARLESLGATRIDIGQGTVDWIVMADPDGNEFCLVS